MSGVVTVDRHGKVTRGGHLLGYVDRRDRIGRPCSTWRALSEGGSGAGHGFRTRRDAVAALVGEPALTKDPS